MLAIRLKAKNDNVAVVLLPAVADPGSRCALGGKGPSVTGVGRVSPSHSTTQDRFWAETDSHFGNARCGPMVACGYNSDVLYVSHLRGTMRTCPQFGQPSSVAGEVRLMIKTNIPSCCSLWGSARATHRRALWRTPSRYTPTHSTGLPPRE